MNFIKGKHLVHSAAASRCHAVIGRSRKLIFLWLIAPLLCMIASLAVVAAFSAMQRRDIHAQLQNLLDVSRQYPNFTVAQRMAVLREEQTERHPRWIDLSPLEIAHRLVHAALSSSSTQAPDAPFSGNLTAITAPAGDVIGMERMGNCSLTFGSASYSLNLPAISYSIASPITNYNQTLHSEAGLTTSQGDYPAGCGDPTLGITSRAVVPVGTTIKNLRVGAWVGYDPSSSNQVMYTLATDTLTDTNYNLNLATISGSVPIGLVAADLNGDQNNDIVSVNQAVATTGTASISVFLANTDGNGSFQAPTNYTLPGNKGVSAVIDDFNGDGIPDIVASSSGSGGYSVTFFAGKSDGTFRAAQSVNLTPPSGVGNPYFGLISADLLGNGKKDLVTSGGIVLLGNGNGTFTQSATVAFPPKATSGYGPNVVAADFNKDGKLDLAVDDAQSITLYLGNGDGTFNPGTGYVTIDNTGYLNATDLDGDGNVDLYSGVAHEGEFAGDQFEFGEAYALMGNGDGTFRGAGYMPFAFTGQNLVDMNGDHIPDGVGFSTTLNSTSDSVTSYLGNKDGTFTTGSTLTISPITISGTPFSFSGLDSFGLGDTRGNGDVDLVYLAPGGEGPNGTSGFFLAEGDNNGSFNTPVFIPAPAFVPSPGYAENELLGNLFVADVNGDGKADLIYKYSFQASTTGMYVQGIAVQLSNGDGTFKAPQTIQIYASTTAPTVNASSVIQVGHTRPNGALDLFVGTIVPSVGTITLQLYLGNGDGTFASPTAPPVADNMNYPSFGSAVGQITLADMNNDGKPDLITLGSTNNNDHAELAISLGNGDGTFQKPTILDFGDGSSVGYGLAAADFNGDGKVDVAVTGFNPPVDTGVFLGKGDGTVQSFTASSGTVEPSEAINLLLDGAALTADFNGDGKPDLVAGQGVLLNETSATNSLTPTSTALQASETSIAAGTSITFTATVAPQSGSGTPTGTVSFSDGATNIGAGALNGSGVATFATSSLAVGTHSITAAYPGDTNFAASTSSVVTVTVTATADFTLAASMASLSVTPGQSGTDTISVTPTNGFNQATSFACSGLPSEASCSFSPASVTPNGTAASTTTMTIATTAPTNSSRNIPAWPFGGGGIVAACGLFFLAKRRRMPSLLCLMLLFVIGGIAVGCGGGGKSSGSGGGGNNNPGTPAGTSTVTVTATAGSISHTAKITLTVQ